MTFKEKVLKALRECPLAVDAGEAYNRREMIAAVERIPDEEHENVHCAAPNYEAMYHEAQQKAQELLKIQDGMAAEIKCLHLANARLTGFKEGLELVFGKDCDGHGCR